MGENIITLICNSCGCDKTEAQEYLDSELQHLRELQELDDLREGDIELACSNLGLDLDYQEYFINRLAGAFLRTGAAARTRLRHNRFLIPHLDGAE